MLYAKYQNIEMRRCKGPQMWMQAQSTVVVLSKADILMLLCGLYGHD